MGALLGVPMRPEQIQDLMRSLGGSKVARTSPSNADSGDQPGTDRPERGFRS
jgi:hypothetical protein